MFQHLCCTKSIAYHNHSISLTVLYSKYPLTGNRNVRDCPVLASVVVMVAQSKQVPDGLRLLGTDVYVRDI